MDEQEFLKKLGLKIKTLRKERKLSLDALAKQHGFEKANLSRLESGRSNPTVITLFKISAALQVSVHKFFEE